MTTLLLAKILIIHASGKYSLTEILLDSSPAFLLGVESQDLDDLLKYH